MKRRNQTFSYPFELERGRMTLEGFVCVFEVSPFNPGRTYGPPESCYPPEGGEVESKTVYFEKLVACVDHRLAIQRAKDPASSRCKVCRRVREERPELEDLVSDEELLEYAGQAAENDREAAEEFRAECRRDDEYDRWRESH